VPALEIPKKYHEGLFKISQLEDETVQTIRRVLDAAPVSEDSSPRSMLSAISSLAQEETKNLRSVVEAIFALYRVRVANDVQIEMFVDDVADAMADVEAEHRIPESERESFREKLRILLGADSLTLLSKAMDLQTSDERSFCSARILTDLRPVFGPKVESGPKAMVVIHTLKLGYHRYGRSGNHDEIHIALDDSDLHTLKDVVDRAMEKAKALGELQKGLPLFGVERE
jgi:hypothetical protein